MTSPKLEFQRDKSLSDKWRAVAHADWFAQVLIFARAEFMENAKTQEQLEGAKLYESILSELAETPEETGKVFEARLRHDIDNPTNVKPKPATKP